MNEFRFPIGKYKNIKRPSTKTFQSWVGTIASFPKQLSTLVEGLAETELSKTYIYMNVFMRFKLAITESKPIIKPYFEAEWAKLADYHESIESSLQIVEGVHQRWIELLNGMSKLDFDYTYIHPEFKNEYDLTEALCQYDWHCRHHLAHIALALKNK